MFIIILKVQISYVYTSHGLPPSKESSLSISIISADICLRDISTIQNKYIISSEGANQKEYISARKLTTVLDSFRHKGHPLYLVDESQFFMQLVQP